MNRLLFFLMILAPVFLSAQCTTVANGSFGNPNNWDCGCDPLTTPACFDSIIIAHNILSNQRLWITRDVEILPGASLTVNGWLVMSPTILDPTSTGRLRNYGTVFADTITWNVGWAHYNHGTAVATDILDYHAPNNSGSLEAKRMVFSGSKNDTTGFLRADELFLIGTVVNRGAIMVDELLHVTGPGAGNGALDCEANSTIFVDSMFWNEGTVTGSGEICVVGTSRNDNVIDGPVLCDSTLTFPGQIVDINTGIIGPLTQGCSASSCGFPVVSVGIEEHELSRPTRFVNIDDFQGVLLIDDFLPDGRLVGSMNKRR